MEPGIAMWTSHLHPLAPSLLIFPLESSTIDGKFPWAQFIRLICHNLPCNKYKTVRSEREGRKLYLMHIHSNNWVGKYDFLIICICEEEKVTNFVLMMFNEINLTKDFFRNCEMLECSATPWKVLLKKILELMLKNNWRK